jgi:hypothetical protein
MHVEQYRILHRMRTVLRKSWFDAARILDVQGVRMKGIQNKIIVSQYLLYTFMDYTIKKDNHGSLFLNI